MSGGEFRASRGDDIEAWLRHWRDRYESGAIIWYVLDDMLDDYREHADTGTLLGEKVRRG